MMENLSMDNYGLYLDFPNVGHLVRRYDHDLAEDVFKKRVVQALFKLRNLEDSIQTSSAGTGHDVKVRRTFDIGVANGLDFYFLDDNEYSHLANIITQKSFKFLDLVIFIHYRYQSKKSKRLASLRFDQFFLRIGFKGAVFTFFHAKGLTRTTPQELLQLIIDTVSNEP